MKLPVLKIMVGFLFALSGMCGLIYEVAWSKYLALFIGTTAYSHMIVLAAYMGGLALGALVLGKFADKAANQCRLYGLIEAAIGIYCFAFPFIMAGAERVFIGIASSLDGSSTHAGLLSLKFALSFATLIIPTFLMGGTLPILTRFLTRTVADSGRDVAILYFINSAGAVVGSGVAGFFLIRTVGLDGAVWLAASLNVLVGLTALLVSKTFKADVPPKPAVTIPADLEQQTFSKQSVHIAVVTAAVSGFIALLYELTWIRLLSNILGSTTYSFTVMLIAFISGIALGGLMVSLFIKKIRNPVGFLALCQYGTAIAMLLTLPLYERLPYFLLKISASLTNRPDQFPLFLGLEFLFCFLLMIVPTTLSGMSLPVAARIASKDIRTLGKSVGGIFFINTIGSVAGALATGLVILPLLGVKSTLELGVLLNGILGITILFVQGAASPRFRIGFALVFVALSAGYRLYFRAWDENTFVSGVFRAFFLQETPSYREFVAMQNEGMKVLWRKEGVNANVAIREARFGDTLQKSLVINGKADASSLGDLQTQILLGQIPLMLYSDTGDVLVVGLGSGITCGSALRHPLKSLDCVEIASEVVECNYFFAQDNYHFMADPRTKIHIDDAFTYLKTSPKKYHHIISEPSNPWIAGIGNLYSVEFFNLCREQLHPGGVLTQWFHTYDANNEIFRLVLRTISRAFPYVTIWKVSNSDIIIVASAESNGVDFEAMEQKMGERQIAQDLARINIHDVPSLLSTQIMSARNNPLLNGPGTVNSDKKPLLEFMAPLSLFTHSAVTLIDSLDERISVQDYNLWLSEYETGRPLTLQNYSNIARYRKPGHIGDVGFTYSALTKWLSLDTSSLEARAMMEPIGQGMNIADFDLRRRQRDHIRTRAELNPQDVSIQFEYVMTLVGLYQNEISIVNRDRMEDAVEATKRCVQITGGREDQYQFVLASLLNGAGRFAEAAEAYQVLLRSPKTGMSGALPEASLLFKIGESHYNAGNLAGAEDIFIRLLALNPKNSEVGIMLKKLSLKKSGIK